MANQLSSFSRDLWKFLRYKFLLTLFRKQNNFNVLDSLHTLEQIKNHNKSFIRFGDGEICILTNKHGFNIDFQKFEPKIKNKLFNVICSNEKDLLLCIPRFYSKDFSNLTLPARTFWVRCVYKTIHSMSFLDTERVYGDAEITRPYMDL